MEGDSNNYELDPSGPFITVVSVDGGCHFGNKLTVITPSEKSENCEENGEFAHPRNQNDENNDSDENGDEFGESPERPNYNDQEESTGGGAYVTVLALGKNPNSDKNNPGGGFGEKKSIVNIFNENEEEEFLAYDPEEDFMFEEQEAEPSEPIPVLRRQRSIVSIEEKAPEIVEQVIVYRLPGERLGFGLRFEGGVTNPSENVRRLFIQSCAEDSPAWRTRTSWDSLVEGDEILEIERVPVSSMTRMDCVQSLKDSSVAVNLLVRHFYSSAEIQLITKAKLLGTSEGERLAAPTKTSASNPCTPEPFLDDLLEDEIQIFEREHRIQKKSSLALRRRKSSSHSTSAESAYGSLCTNANSNSDAPRLSSSLSGFSSNSACSSDDNYYDREEQQQPATYDDGDDGENGDNETCVTKHKLLLEVDDNNEMDGDLYEPQMPQAPPRKLIKSTCGHNSIESVITRSGGILKTPVGDLDLDLRLKPPAGFDDSLDWELQNNFPDSVLDIMNMSDLLLEAERIRQALNNEATEATAALFSGEDLDGDGSASTRSTVISRLSMASSAATTTTTSMDNNNTNNNNMQIPMHKQNSGRGSSSSGHMNTNAILAPQGNNKLMMRPGLEKSLIPLEPPLSFQDYGNGNGGEGEDAPFQMPVNSVNIIHSNSTTMRMYEQEYYNNDEEDDHRCLTSNSVSDDMWSPYPNPDEDELALFAQELGQDAYECGDYIQMNQQFDANQMSVTRFQNPDNGDGDDSSDAEVMIRIEWLHEIEEFAQILEPEVFPLVNVV